MTHLAYSRTFPAAPETAYQRVLVVPLERILGRRHLAIPGVRSVEQQEAWGRRLGQQRIIRLADGSCMRETLTALDAPRSYGYLLTDLAGPMKLLIAEVEGRWSFEPEGHGTRITWVWEVRPTGPGRFAMPGFARMWTGSAARAFDEIGVVLRR